MKNNIINLINNRTSIQELLESVKDKSLNPEDKYEIAAVIESLGYNDERVQEKFGVEDVFELATLLWDLMQENVNQNMFVPQKKITLSENISSIVKSFFRGLIFALPMAISVLSMMTLRFSLWSYKYLSTELATSISIGTILSFMCVGGFTQAIARRGFFYLGQGFYNMAKRVTYYLIKLGYVSCIIVCIVYLFFNVFFYNFTGKMLFVIVVYYLFLSSNWLSVTVMNILRREFTFTAILTLGIGIVFILFKIFRFNIIFSQIIALICTSIIGLLLVIYFFNKEEDKNEKGIAPALPQMSIMLYSLLPYFGYGFLYFTFLFIDRIVSWSTNNANMPYIIWFRGNYELGLDFALLTLIFPMAIAEVIVTRFMSTMEIIQLNSWNHNNEDVHGRYIRLYKRSMVFILISVIISAIIMYFVVKLVNSESFILYDENYLSNFVTSFVFIVGIIAYSILVLALTNALLLFSLSQPIMVTKVLGYALVGNFVVGFLMSRWFNYDDSVLVSLMVRWFNYNPQYGYSFAVFGLLFGCVIFFIGTTRYVLKVLKNLDYYIYAAL